jgi:hypothetical protein
MMSDKDLSPEEIALSWEDLDNLESPSEEELTAEDLESLLESIGDTGAEARNREHVQSVVQSARSILLRRDRSQLIRDLERAHALATTMDDPEVTASLENVLARVRSRDV